MAWIGPAIMAGKAGIDYFKNKKNESSRLHQLQGAYNDRYHGPLAQAYRAYLTDYFNKNNLGERMPGISIESLVAPPKFDGTAAKIPGAGGRLGGGVIDALAAYYGNTHPNGTGAAVKGAAGALLGGGGGGSAAPSFPGGAQFPGGGGGMPMSAPLFSIGQDPHDTAASADDPSVGSSATGTALDTNIAAGCPPGQAWSPRSNLGRGGCAPSGALGAQ
jgi:hypothetical protein